MAEKDSLFHNSEGCLGGSADLSQALLISPMQLHSPSWCLGSDETAGSFHMVFLLHSVVNDLWLPREESRRGKFSLSLASECPQCTSVTFF